MASDPAPRPVLFTAFEPSGDEHASSVIAALRARNPSLPILAAGGPKMRAAGADVLLDTTHDAVMGLPGLRKILEHRRLNARIARIMDERKPALLVPVDSPAANWPICALARARAMRVMHLVAPQLWAWAPWRIRKARRLTDHLMCVLPFEEAYFTSRGVRATFIGHPLFDEPLDEPALTRSAHDLGLPDGSPRLALLPGSRPSEIDKNFPLMLAAFRTLAAPRPGLVGAVAAVSTHAADRIRRLASLSGPWPDRLHMAVGGADPILHWCDAAVAVSGTVTLRVARHGRPMVVVYRFNPILWNIAPRWLIRTRFITLPNIVSGRRIVPELAPYHGSPARLTRELGALLANRTTQQKQREDQASLRALFAGRHAAETAARLIDESLAAVGGQPLLPLGEGGRAAAG
jgi:lipid-A-disaccharide synthase